jgi:hypothetical protein
MGTPMGEVRRVIAREHTSLRPADDRVALENSLSRDDAGRAEPPHLHPEPRALTTTLCKEFLKPLLLEWATGDLLLEVACRLHLFGVGQPARLSDTHALG